MRTAPVATVVLALFGLSAALTGGNARAAESALWRDDVRRIESACEIALGQAKDREERMRALRRRNRELAALVELAGQSLLVRMVRRPDLAAVFEDERELWLETLNGDPAESEEDLRRHAARLNGRLLVFERIIASGLDVPSEERR